VFFKVVLNDQAKKPNRFTYIKFFKEDELIMKFRNAIMKYIVEPMKRGKKAVVTGTMALGALIYGQSAHAASTGNTDVDTILTGLTGVFDIIIKGFVALAIAAIPVTIIVLAFFWLRGKLKQSVTGA
jgi:hypothetical protein